MVRDCGEDSLVNMRVVKTTVAHTEINGLEYSFQMLINASD